MSVSMSSCRCLRLRLRLCLRSHLHLRLYVRLSVNVHGSAVGAVPWVQCRGCSAAAFHILRLVYLVFAKARAHGRPHAVIAYNLLRHPVLRCESQGRMIKSRI
jgi:hypothetical protein